MRDNNSSSRLTDARDRSFPLTVTALLLVTLYFSTRNGFISSIFLLPKYARIGLSLDWSLLQDRLFSLAQGIYASSTNSLRVSLLWALPYLPSKISSRMRLS